MVGGLSIAERRIRDVSAYINRRKATRLALLAALLTGCAIEPLVVLSHTSDPTQSRYHETTTDFIGVGVTLTRGSFETDLALGRRAINCGPPSCESTWGGLAEMKWRPMRARR
jgi:hypothetical protein